MLYKHDSSIPSKAKHSVNSEALNVSDVMKSFKMGFLQAIANRFSGHVITVLINLFTH